ncbi:MAG TPA: hypothetical protein PL131_00925 [Methylotenera sp.]|nr:hypothetical protein [Methylotenera sp.]HPH04410.1 hypothetical protein [Methylotenera sp.]HPM99964.1 hypothetical protein [Methylotenera sp.]
MPETKITITERIVMTFFGGITGGLYGFILWLIAFYITESYHSSIITWSIAVFSVLGMMFGNFILEAFLAFLHFIWGMVRGLSTYIPGYYRRHDLPPIYEDDMLSHLKAFALVGFGTGIVLLLWWRF